MGWSFGWSTRKEMVDRIIQPFFGESGMSYTCLAHTSSGGRILWSVWETNEKRFIRCDLTKKTSYGWGHKAMDESMYPYYFSCPLEFLELAPVTCEEWREKVREYHAKQNRKVEIGQTIELVNATIPYVTIVSTRPLRGVYLGKSYRIPKRMLGKALQTTFST